MSSNSELKNIADNLKDKRLAMFVVCCHVDKPLEEHMPESIYNIPIQAGAALTDARVCELNDYDDTDNTISDRNQRYSEMTAMYWIGQNIITDYIGISHYRRRFLLSDKQLSDYMDEGFDIITTKPYPLPEIVKENYLAAYYGYDWNLFTEILKKHSPEYLSLADTEFSKDHIHPCNMNIFKGEVYNEYCEFVFPILNEFYEKSPWKYDTYQRRDVGFIGERLSSLFVEKKRSEGYKIIEAPFSDLRSKGWTPADECNLTDFNAIYSACQKYYLQANITRCRNLVSRALENGGINDKRICDMALLFKTAIQEQKSLPQTMFEYLPDKWSDNLDTLIASFNGLRTIVKLHETNNTAEVQSMYDEFILATGFSNIAINFVKSL